MDLFAVVMVVVFGFLGYLLIRNTWVFNARTRLLRQIKVAGEQDINTYNDWRWRYDEYDKVSYGDMMVQFWRKPESMYDNLDFVDPAVKRGILTGLDKSLLN